MYLMILKNYIKKMNIFDIYNFCAKNNISASDEEMQTIYNYIKNYYEDIFKDINNIYPLFNELKNKLSTNTYNTMIKLFEINYKKYFE